MYDYPDTEQDFKVDISEIKKTMVKNYMVSATFYEYMEAESEEEAIKKFEDTGTDDLTLDTATLKASEAPY